MHFSHPPEVTVNVCKWVFAELMAHLPLTTFRRCVVRCDGEHKVKRFSCLQQLLVMVFAQLAFRESLRDIEACLRAQPDKLYHMGIRCTVARNTLANANAVRNWLIYAEFAWAKVEKIPLAESGPAETKSDQSKQRRAIVAALMNMKGGVGKSTVNANFGWHAAYRHDARVLMIDLDPQFNLSQYILGTKGYELVLEEQAPTIEVLFKDSKEGGKPGSLNRSYACRC